MVSTFNDCALYHQAVSTFDNYALYHQTMTPICFWCRWGLNSKFFIQPSKILLVELIRTHLKDSVVSSLCDVRSVDCIFDFISFPTCWLTSSQISHRSHKF